MERNPDISLPAASEHVILLQLLRKGVNVAITAGEGKEHLRRQGSDMQSERKLQSADKEWRDFEARLSHWPKGRPYAPSFSTGFHEHCPDAL